MTWHTLCFLLTASTSSHFFLISWVLVDVVLAVVHQAAPDLEKKFYALFAQNIVVDA
jgi:hypothetical protein